MIPKINTLTSFTALKIAQDEETKEIIKALFPNADKDQTVRQNALELVLLKAILSSIDRDSPGGKVLLTGKKLDEWTRVLKITDFKPKSKKTDGSNVNTYARFTLINESDEAKQFAFMIDLITSFSKNYMMTSPASKPFYDFLKDRKKTGEPRREAVHNLIREHKREGKARPFSSAETVDEVIEYYA